MVNSYKNIFICEWVEGEMTIAYECELVFCHDLFVILDRTYNMCKLHIPKST